METEPWQPGRGEEVPDEWKEGEGPPEFPETTEEPDVPDPNMNGMPTIWGYEDCDFDKKKKERPPHEHHKVEEEPVPQEVKSVSTPGEDVCRQAITSYVDGQCWGKEPLTTMTINSITPSGALTFTVETYVEKRKVGYEYKPYKGGEIDDPSHGRAPECWEMKIKCKELFKKQDEKEEVPHTSTVRTCHYCCGLGFMRCHVCMGWGCHVCRHCSGVTSMVAEGEEGAVACCACNDTHHEQCSTCGGEGRRLCPACDGYHAIRCFIQLKVKFKNYKEMYVKEDTDLPDMLIKDVKGVTILEHAGNKLAPLTSFPVEEINTKSAQFLSKHQLELLDKKRLLQQRMKVQSVPVTEVQVTWKEENGRFWVYGNENKVYCPDYPDTCACCVIL